MKKVLIVVLMMFTATAWGMPLDTQLERQVAQQTQVQNILPHVACELKTTKGYQLMPQEECLKNPAAAQEIRLLQKFVEELSQEVQGMSFNTKYLGPVNLSEQIYNQTFLVNHSWRPITVRFMGFGPEDDPEFDYTQPGYYPAGTVKVNMTERAFDVIRLYYGDILPRYGRDGQQARGLRGFVGMVFFHEMLHGWQLHTLPVLDYKRMGLEKLNEMLVSRQPDAKIIWGSQQIINYEEDANVFSYQYTASVLEDFKTFVKAFETLSAEPVFFQKYPLLADTFYDYYLVNEVAGAEELMQEIARGKTLDTFNELNTYTYRGQVAPLQTWADMVGINDRIAGGTPCGILETQVRGKYEYFMNLSVPEWNGRTADNPHDSIIMDTIRSIEKSYPGLPETKEAALKEFKTFEKRCNIKL